jgi:hypothetical protein
VPPGTYQVTVNSYGPSWSSLPDGRASVAAAQVVSSAISNLVADVKTVPVAGNVTLNGAAPATGVNCSGSTSGKAAVNFLDEVGGTAINLTVPCSSSTFAFSGNVPPGTYQVTVNSYGPSWSSLPDGRASVAAAQTVNSAASNLVLDVKTVPVAGNITLNGATPATGVNCSGSTSGKAAVNFLDDVGGTSINFTVPCSSSTFAFSGNLPSGTYQVSVNSYGPSWSSLPDGRAGVTTLKIP